MFADEMQRLRMVEEIEMAKIKRMAIAEKIEMSKIKRQHCSFSAKSFSIVASEKKKLIVSSHFFLPTLSKLSSLEKKHIIIIK